MMQTDETAFETAIEAHMTTACGSELFLSTSS